VLQLALAQPDFQLDPPFVEVHVDRDQRVARALDLAHQQHVGKRTQQRQNRDIGNRRGKRITKVRVLALPSARQTSRSDATLLYEINDEIQVAEGESIDT